MAELDYETGTEQMQSYDPIPVAKYEAMITESELKATVAGNGSYLNITWTITDGEYQGRKVFDMVTIHNANQQAVDIGKRQMNTLSAAVGYPPNTRISDSQMLHDRPCLIDVRIQPAGPDKKKVYREAKNVIKGYAALGETAAPAPVAKQASASVGRPQTAPAGAAPAPAAGKPAWAKRG